MLHFLFESRYCVKISFTDANIHLFSIIYLHLLLVLDMFAFAGTILVVSTHVVIFLCSCVCLMIDFEIWCVSYCMDKNPFHLLLVSYVVIYHPS